MATRTLLAIETELNATLSDPTVVAMRRFGMSIRLFLANDHHLAELIRDLVTDAWEIDLFGLGMDAVRAVALEELARRLHNYVAAAKSLVDHTRRHPGFELDDAFAKRVKSEIGRRFGQPGVVQFVHDLRNYVAHYELLPVRLHEHRTYGKPKERALVMVRDALVKSSFTWSAGARDYLTKAGALIDLEQVRNGYTDTVVEFHHWVGEQLPNATLGLMAKRAALTHEMRQAVGAPFFAATRALLRLLKKGIGTPEDLPQHLLRMDQIRAGRLKGEPLEKLLDVVKAEYPRMPKGLLARLSALFRDLAFTANE